MDITERQPKTEKKVCSVCVCHCVGVDTRWPACGLACAMKRLTRCKLCAKAAMAFCWQNTELDRSQRSKSGWSGRARMRPPPPPTSKLPSSAQLNGTCNYMAGCSAAANNTHQRRTPRAELRQKKKTPKYRPLVKSFGFIGSTESVWKGGGETWRVIGEGFIRHIQEARSDL